MVDPTISRYQLYRKQWIAGIEGGDQWRQYVAAKRGCRGDAKPPLGFAVWCSDGLLSQGQVTFDMPDTLIILRTRRRQRHAAGGTAEQAHLQMALQACQVLADRCRAKAQGTGAAGDAAGLDHLDEAADGVEQVHARALAFVRISL
ncbi:hypothetical protein D3C80_1363010 [compost metagenome]